MKKKFIIAGIVLAGFALTAFLEYTSGLIFQYRTKLQLPKNDTEEKLRMH
jgi:hypothetical protein